MTRCIGITCDRNAWLLFIWSIWFYLSFFAVTPKAKDCFETTFIEMENCKFNERIREMPTEIKDPGFRGQHTGLYILSHTNWNNQNQCQMHKKNKCNLSEVNAFYVFFIWQLVLWLDKKDWGADRAWGFAKPYWATDSVWPQTTLWSLLALTQSPHTHTHTHTHAHAHTHTKTPHIQLLLDC